MFFILLLKYFTCFLFIVVSFIMSASNMTVEDLKSILDEKLVPLKSDVIELRQKIEETNKFLQFTNTKYEEMQKTFDNIARNKKKSSQRTRF